MAEINQICIDPISCHAYSGNLSRLALSPNNNLVHIYQQQDPTWVEETVLSQHDLRITSIDWAPKTDRIVTCSADRNAYVWVEASDKTWKPTLVLLRINRAATCVKWSPNEDKFAVATSAKLVCVCYFESANDWWVSKHIKKPIKSTVTSLDWHPDNILLACGSTDYKTRIFSTFIKEVDQSYSKDTPWLQYKLSSIDTTGNLVQEFSSSGSWVHDVAFSPDGTKLAWISHASSISVVDSLVGLTIITLKTRYLPFLSCLWVSNRRIVAAGHDCCPMLFGYEAGCNNQQNGDRKNTTPSQALKFIGRLDRSQKKEADGFSAMRKFRDLDAKGNNADEQTASNLSDTSLGTIHQNTIRQIRKCCKNKDTVDKLATVGLDGKLVVWSLDQSVF